MSAGKEGDWLETQNQIKNPNPIQAGKTWLRHGEFTQSALIDLMLLEGNTINDIAEELNKKFGKKQLSQRKQRVKSHINHLMQGSDLDKITGIKGHQLKLVEKKGKWEFINDGKDTPT